MEVRKKVWEHRRRRSDRALSEIQHLDGLEETRDLAEAEKKQQWEARATVAEEDKKVEMHCRQ